MPTNSTPVTAWVASIMTATGVNQSSSLTVTVNITSGWEIQLPIQVQFSNVSADPVISVYPTMDGGANYDTTAMATFSVARIGSGTGRASIRLPVGQYAIQILNSGPNSASVAVLTQAVITAINNA